MSKRLIKLALMTGASCAVSMPALAQDDGGDIIVTARRVSERLADVPISITVLSQEAIANRNIVNAGDLGAYVPSLSTNSYYGPEKSSFAIRGFTQEAKTAPSVGVYFADVVAPRSSGGSTSGNGSGPGSFFDLENVQVLKGPQGTLFGRNTTGGAVLLVPKKPVDRFEGYVEGSLGSHDLRRVQAVLNAPLSDTFLVRAGVDINKREGYLVNRSGVGPDRFRDTDYVAARLSIVGKLTPDLENYMVASFSRSKNNGTVPSVKYCDRDRSDAFLGGDSTGFLPYLSCNQFDRQQAGNYGFWDVENNHPDPGLRVKQWQVINTTTWQATDTLSVKNIASYAEFREAAAFSLNGDNFLVPGTSWPLAPFVHINPGNTGDTSAQSTFTEELQLHGAMADGRLDWQAGAYLEISNPLGFSSGLSPIFMSCTDVATFQCTDPLGFGTVSSANTKDHFNTKGFYAQATYDLDDRFSVTGGIRYTIDKVRSVAENVTLLVPTPGTTVGFCQNRLAFNNGDLSLPLFVTSPAQCHWQMKIKSEKPTWLLGLDYKPNEDMLLYAKYSRGYRQGGINPNNIGIESWGPEKVDNYEIGAKTEFRGAVPGFFNIAAFYSDFQNQQLAATLLVKTEYTNSIPPAQAIVNAGKSRMWGIEVDTSVRPFAGFKLDVSYAYLNAKLKSISVPTAPFVYEAILPNAIEGDVLALSPKNRVTVSGSYTLPLDQDIGDVTLSANFTHTDANNAVSALTTPYNRLKATDLLNLNVSWSSIFQMPIDLSFFMTNATNQKRIVYPALGWATLGAGGGQTNEPRMWGLRLKYRFGE